MDRKYLRKKIQQLLKDANIPGVGQDVFSMRSIPTGVDSLPLILLYPKNETLDRFDEAPKRYRRSLDMIIEIQTVHDDDELLTDEMDDLAAKVEQVIEDDIVIEADVEHIELKTVAYDTEGDGQSPIGAVKMTYEIEYITEPRSEVAHPDFNQADAVWNANGHPDDSTKDTIIMNP